MRWKIVESPKTVTFVRKVGKSCKIFIPTPLHEDFKGRVVKVTLEIIK